MGMFYSVYCKKCGYRNYLNHGHGFLYGETYSKAMNDGKEGKLGEEIKNFLLMNPEGILDVEFRIAQCKKCGEYASVKALNMYVPDETTPKCNKKIVFPDEIGYYYKLYKEFPHKCKKCNGIMKLVPKINDYNLKCPNCGDVILECRDEISWS